MTHPISAAQPLTLIHPMCLFEEPALDSRALGLLLPGDYRAAGEAIQGFVPVETADGPRGFLLAAACAPQAAQMRGGEPPAVGVVQDVALYRSPAAGAQFGARSIVQPDEALLVLRHEGKFIHVQRPNGQTGYVPEVLCRAEVGYQQPVVRLVQPVSLYGDPRPGSQLESRWAVSPSETLLLLGHDGRFALVQRDDGQLGFVPSVLLGQSASDSLLPIGPADLGWITLGGIWGLINWGSLLTLISRLFGDLIFGPYLGLAALAGVVGVLWFVARRRVAARSFAVGLLLAYAFIHLASGGTATLWR